MKQFALKAKISSGFLLALVVVLSVSLMAYRDIRDLIDINQQVTRAHKVISTIEQVLSDLKDTETGQRGFLITGEDEYLEPYRVGLSMGERTMQTLRRLTADNPAQQRHLA